MCWLIGMTLIRKCSIKIYLLLGSVIPNFLSSWYP